MSHLGSFLGPQFPLGGTLQLVAKAVGFKAPRLQVPAPPLPPPSHAPPLPKGPAPRSSQGGRCRHVLAPGREEGEGITELTRARRPSVTPGGRPSYESETMAVGSQSPLVAPPGSGFCIAHFCTCLGSPPPMCHHPLRVDSPCSEHTCSNGRPRLRARVAMNGRQISAEFSFPNRAAAASV